ncbi:Non-specific serine/threonine protein kinase [Handroanthus impetiginosus]|uniref:non-specific serine/threonine protein kinase n=1 Tax=Handroanthus impetiginosus TaxID=429701 RepID=A0A2G9GTK8_9LAMI|nr:Non-specific serine/threonine protein kinase [Handroanthus impetiginosus]
MPLVPSEITNVADAMALPPIDKTQQEKAKSLSPNEITSVANALPCRSGNTLSEIRKQLTRVSFKVQNVTSTLREQINSKMINAEKKDGRKTTIQKLVRLRTWVALRNKAKPSKKKDLVTFSKSAPLSHGTDNMTLSGITISTKMIVGNSQLILNTKLRSFHFLELKAATRNFSNDTIVGEGGFGTVYKGWLKEESIGKQESGSVVAVKKLHYESMQGFEEWQSEVNFLGRFSHPNLVKLLGYYWEDDELLLAYEFMQKGTLENHLLGSKGG